MALGWILDFSADYVHSHDHLHVFVLQTGGAAGPGGALMEIAGKVEERILRWIY